MYNNVVVIPARQASTRLPDKLMLDLGGKSIVQRVFDQCKLANNIDLVIIAVDTQELYDHCKLFCNHVILTSATHQSGTDRIAEAIFSIDCNNIINVQGDEPFIDPNLINEIATTVSEENYMVSAMHLLDKDEEIENPNNVKVVTNNSNLALYFSRAPIPYNRDQNKTKQKYYKHLGIYGYTKKFLSTITKIPPSNLELTEKLEQLRVLQYGFQIKMIATEHEPIGIDTLQDYNNAKALFDELI